MRTLKEIDEEIEVKSTARAEEIISDVSPFLSEGEVTALQSNARFSDKYREMYDILQVLEEYLKHPSMDGRSDRQPLRKKLGEMLAAL